MSIVELHFTAFQFWNCAPRKLIMMIEETKRAEKTKMKTLAYYTAMIFNGKNPDEAEEEAGGIAGIDYPAGEGATSWLHN